MQRNVVFRALFPVLFVAFSFFVSCKDEEEDTLTVNVETIAFGAGGGTQSFSVTTSASSWQIDNPDSAWVTLSPASGTSDKKVVSVTVSSRTLEDRTATLTISAGNAPFVTVAVTQSASSYLYDLSVSVESFSFKKAGGDSSFVVTTTAPKWSVACDASWLTFSDTSGTSSPVTITVTASANGTADERTATVTITGQYVSSKAVAVTQSGDLYPSYNTSPIASDITGMESTATQLAKNMYAGWNLGNSLEVPNGETLWGNPLTTQQLIDSVYNAGFNAIRIPCAWNSYIENTTTCKLSDTWLARVKEVIDYCYKHNMYVIINIHWDGGWLEENCTTAKQEVNNAKQKAIWEQIATYFRDYDEHLLFAGTNEPSVSDAAGMTVLLSYEQTFIDAVRSTGGRNAYRVLIFQGPSTDIEKTNTLMTTLPTDIVSSRLMAEVHYYTPWNFCGLEADASWGKMFYYWGANYHSTTDATRNATWGEESALISYFTLMKTKFSSKGIPVVLGEYGAIRRSGLTGDALTNHLASRAYYIGYVAQQAKNYGMVPFYWDNGYTSENGFALFYRSSGAVFDSQALKALMAGASNGSYPF